MMATATDPHPQWHPVRWSFSQLKQLTDCGEAYGLKRGLLGEKPPHRPWAQAVGGLAFHDTIEEWEKQGREPDPVDIFHQRWKVRLLETFEKQPDLNLWMVPPRTVNREKAIESVRTRFLEQDLPNYISYAKKSPWRIAELPDGGLAQELEFEVSHDGVGIVGYVDRVLTHPNGDILIEDIKTGSADRAESDPRQLEVYRVGVERVYGVYADRGRYYFTKLGRPSEAFNLRQRSDEAILNDYLTANEVVGGRLLLPRPSKDCAVCDVRPWCSLKGWLQPGEELDSTTGVSTV